MKKHNQSQLSTRPSVNLKLRVGQARGLRRRLTPPLQSDESGYALLTVFVMAAMIAISFYMALPRLMFEAQRDKEQLLIDRGEQYSVAIRRFYVKAGRYPMTMDELESFQSMRFLRRRYKDPMTKSGEWRIIHVNQAGIMTDSLTQPMSQGGQVTAGQTSSFGTLQGSTMGNSLQGTMPGSANPSGTNPDNAAPPTPNFLAQRPSDRGPGQGAPGNAATNPGANSDNGDLQPPQYPPDPNAAILQQPQPGQPGQPGQPVQPGQPGQLPPGLPFGSPQQPGQLANGQPMPGQQPAGSDSSQPNPGQLNSAAQQIMSQLTHPAQNPAASGVGGGIGAGVGGATSNSPFSGAGGPMIAGVASKAELPAIKVYNEKTKYNLWEFLFDYRKQQQQGQQQAQQAQQANGASNPGVGANGLQSNSPFGNTLGGNAPATPGIGNPAQPNPSNGVSPTSPTGP